MEQVVLEQVPVQPQTASSTGQMYKQRVVSEQVTTDVVYVESLTEAAQAVPHIVIVAEVTPDT